MSTEDYAAKNNWVLDEGEPKKTNDSVVETATVESETMTAGGESTSADTSLEQSKTFDQGRSVQVKGTVVYENDYLRVYTIGSKNAELTLKEDGWFLQSKQPDGTVLYNKYTDVDDILRRNSNLFN